jgi:predicted small secreted protein
MGSITRNLRQNAQLLTHAVVMGMLGLFLLTACHTTAGFGQDMQSAGRNIENKANKNNQ